VLGGFPDRVWKDVAHWAAGQENIQRVWLFGSRARGDHAGKSDVDIAVEIGGDGVDEIQLRWMDRSGQWKKELKDLFPLSIEIDVELANIEFAQEIVAPAVERDGVLLFERQRAEHNHGRI
jgi:uncharacterized protein